MRNSCRHYLKKEEVNQEWQRLKDALIHMEGYPQKDALTKEAILDEDLQVDSDLLAWEAFAVLSPSGECLLFSFEGFPASVSLKDGVFRFLVPDTALGGSALTFFLDLPMTLLLQSHINWSKDGTKALLSSPFRVFMQMKMGDNLPLLDLVAGTWSLLDQPFAVLGEVTVADFNKISGGVPYYAVFGETDETAYLFYYGINKDGARVSQIRAQSLETGEQKVFSEFPMEWSGTWPILTTDKGLVMTFRDYRAGSDRGILLFDWEGERKETLMTSDEILTLGIDVIRVADLKSGQAVFNLASENYSKPANFLTWPRAVDALDGTVFDNAIALDADGQVVKVDPRLLLSEEFEPTGLEILRNGELFYRLPSDATLSPDGRSLLLAFPKNPVEGTSFYLLNLETGASFEVTMEGGYPFPVFPGGRLKSLGWPVKGLVTLMPRMLKEPVFYTFK